MSAIHVEGYGRVIFIDATQRGDSPSVIFRGDYTSDDVWGLKPDQNIV